MVSCSCRSTAGGCGGGGAVAGGGEFTAEGVFDANA